MTQDTVIKVPDIGDFSDVEIIDILVSPGDVLEIETPLLTLESDKASMDMPSPTAGTVTELLVAVGDRVSADTPVMMARASSESRANQSSVDGPREPAPQSPSTSTVSSTQSSADIRAELVVLGSGPGGYTAAFRAADLGIETVLIEKQATLGGVCLNVGCIPSKALLHAARVIEETREMEAAGIEFGRPNIHLEDLRNWKNSIVSQLTAGLAGLAKKRNVRVIQGTGQFTSASRITVDDGTNQTVIDFAQAIIAAGSEPTGIPGLPEDNRLINSTGALSLVDVPERFLIIGGGIIGLEMATVYHALGSRVTVVEMTDQLMPGTDSDLLRPLGRRLKNQCENIFLSTRVSGVVATPDGLIASFEGSGAPESERFDRVLVAVGRRPNGHLIGADNAGVAVDDQGFIAVDPQQRTNVEHILAIGDIVGMPMLAHKATHEGKVAAEVVAGLPSAFDARVIPSVAYTDPEVAWVGLTESEAKSKGVEYGKGVFPWAASGRALGLGRPEGLTKLLFDPETRRIIGAGIVGLNAGDLIAQACLAIEMQAEAKDISLTVSPHPTLSETVSFAAEAFEGTITDLYLSRKK